MRKKKNKLWRKVIYNDECMHNFRTVEKKISFFCRFQVMCHSTIVLLSILAFYFGGCSTRSIEKSDGWIQSYSVSFLDSPENCHVNSPQNISLIWDEPLLSESDFVFAADSIRATVYNSSYMCMRLNQIIIEVVPSVPIERLSILISYVYDLGISKVSLKLDPPMSWEVSTTLHALGILWGIGADIEYIVSFRKSSINELDCLLAEIHKRGSKISLLLPLGTLYRVLSMSYIMSEYKNIVGGIYYEMTDFWVPSKSKYLDTNTTPFRTMNSTRDLVRFLTDGGAVPYYDVIVLRSPPLPITAIVSVSNHQTHNCVHPSKQRGCYKSSNAIEFGITSLNFFIQFLTDFKKTININFAISSVSEIPTSWTASGVYTSGASV